MRCYRRYYREPRRDWKDRKERNPRLGEERQSKKWPANLVPIEKPKLRDAEIKTERYVYLDYNNQNKQPKNECPTSMAFGVETLTLI